MKKIVLLLTVILLHHFAFSQNNVGIGTNTPHPSAALDITSTNKGLLIPRVSLKSSIDWTTIPSPAAYLLVFNESTLLSGGKGFYYNAGTPASPSWKPLSDINLPFYKAGSDSTRSFNIENYSSSYNSYGIRGFAQNGHGLDGASVGGLGVFGSTYTGSGVVGESKNGGTAVVATSLSNSGYALKTSGNVKIAGGLTNPGMGKVLTSDASGNATWKENRVAFRAKGVNSKYREVANDTWTKVEFAIEDYDYSNGYSLLSSSSKPNSGTSVFTIPAAGLYHFDAQVGLETNDVFDTESVLIRLLLRRDGNVSELTRKFINVNDVTASDAALSADFKLLFGDQVWIEYAHFNWSTTSSNLETYNTNNFFSGHLVFAD